MKDKAIFHFFNVYPNSVTKKNKKINRISFYFLILKQHHLEEISHLICSFWQKSDSKHDE